MKKIGSLTLLIIIAGCFWSNRDQSIKEHSNRSTKEALKVQTYQLSEEIIEHSNFKNALKSIEVIDELEKEAKRGQFLELEDKILKLEKEVSHSPNHKSKIDFQNCLSLWIKYFQKRMLKDHPQELFRFLTYNPNLYKQYLLAVHEGFAPEMTYQQASQFLLESLKGVQK